MAKKKKAAKKGKSRDVLVVASKVKAYMKSKNMNTSADAITCLSNKLYSILDEATNRTRANGRKTIKPQDV
jgi:histone H3/H4